MRRRGARGAGLLSSVFGLLFFLLFLLAAIQLLYGLYTTSVATDAAYDAARHVAGRVVEDGAAAEAEARAQFHEVLGGLDAELTFAYEGDDVVVHLTARPPTFLPSDVAGALPYTTIDRTIRVRIEDLR